MLGEGYYLGRSPLDRDDPSVRLIVVTLSLNVPGHPEIANLNQNKRTVKPTWTTSLTNRIHTCIVALQLTSSHSIHRKMV